MESAPLQDLTKPVSLRRYSFALRENFHQTLPDETIHILEAHLLSDHPDIQIHPLLSFLDQNIHEQRKTLATNPTPLFKSLIQVLNHVQTDLSLMGYLLPLVDGILFGDLFEY